MSAEPELTERDVDRSGDGPASEEPTAVEANVVGTRVDEMQSRDDEVDEWFARAATGHVSEEGDTPEHERLGAATLPVHDDGLVRPPRPKRVWMRSSAAARRRRALPLAAFTLLIVVIIDMRLVSSQTTTVIEPVIATDTSASIDKLSDTVDRRLSTIARQKRTERQERAKRRRLAARRLAAARAHARASTRASGKRATASPPVRRIPSPARRHEATPRRSICGPFDLC
jgi:predicted transcriptional regulator